MLYIVMHHRDWQHVMVVLILLFLWFCIFY
jgi:hypothetical protein